LLFKSQDSVLVESKRVAEKRLRLLEKRLDRDPELRQQYGDKIEQYVAKGYARKLNSEEASIEVPKTWYLPHFGTINPNKEVKKLRLVFDAASRSNGKSLNDYLLCGPNLLVPLPEILFNFRKGQFACASDISEMFHQVRIRREDQSAQRFLWRGADRDRPPDTYQMNVMIFGAVCSPFSAQATKNLNADRFEPEYPEAVRKVKENFYMDDFLDSVNSEDEAVRIIREVTLINSQGGFKLCNWISNSPEINATIPEELRSPKMRDLGGGSSLTEKILGLSWNPESDELAITCSVERLEGALSDREKRPTKREVLRVVMSLFDPLGIITPFVVRGRILLQEIWRSEIGWDDELSGTVHKKWLAWVDMMETVAQVRIPRCYFGGQSSCTDRVLQIHVFCDASEKAFAAVAYLRFSDGGKVGCSLIMSRARVAPLRPLSIPRLELQAAVMGARMLDTIKKSHGGPEGLLERSVLWSDSRTVLQWIKGDPRRYKQFVAQRIGEIVETTEGDSWRWVPTHENVADEATRDSDRLNLSQNSRWVRGPEFLRKPECDWPIDIKKGLTVLDVESQELKAEFTGVVQDVGEIPDVVECVPEVERFSSWSKYIRTMGWVLRFIRNCKARVGVQEMAKGELSVEESRVAEIWCLKGAQSQSFPNEVRVLTMGKDISKRSSIRGLSPYLGDDGLLRIRGRLEEARNIGAEVKNPVILNGKHELSKLLIDYYHVQAAHQGQEFVVNEIRQRYWITGIRNAVRSAWSRCLVCEFRRVSPRIPEMGNLPEVRLTDRVRPFTYTGVDCFGPMEVKIGRRREKRYGIIFTCMTVRAIHIELLENMSTDSTILAFRRFIARRGCPQEMWSDCGTNFRGMNSELSRLWASLDQERLKTVMGLKGINWRFNPPRAPHMGGVWERLIRSVKTALTVTLKEKAPKQETLLTLLAEAENIVNSRPLTHVSIDPSDPEALTPNHFILGSSGSSPTWGKFSDKDLCLKKQWRIAQRLADMFWQRWLKEYLPSLVKRSKWFDKAEPVKVGDFVLIVDDETSRNLWLKGVVERVFPGKDGQVRAVDVRTKLGVFRRPTVKICILNVQGNNA